MTKFFSFLSYIPKPKQICFIGHNYSFMFVKRNLVFLIRRESVYTKEKVFNPYFINTKVRLMVLVKLCFYILITKFHFTLPKHVIKADLSEELF